MNASKMYGNGSFSYRITVYNIQKAPIDEVPKINAMTSIGSGFGETVSLLETNQNANPAIAKPKIAHRNIFISDLPRNRYFLQLSEVFFDL